MTRVSVSLAGALAVLAMVACAPTLAVQSDFDRTASFDNLRTFAWAPAPNRTARDSRGSNPLLADRIRDSIEASMQARGFRKADGGTPDMLIAYYAAIETKLDVDEVDQLYGWRGRWTLTTTEVREYEQGTLVIDIADARTNRAVWRGWGEGVVNRSTNPETNQQRLRDAVDRILEAFPPAGGS